jgi:hypothetical protein
LPDLNIDDWLLDDDAGRRPRARRKRQESVVVVMKMAAPLFEALDRMVDLMGTKKTRFIVSILRRRLPEMRREIDTGRHPIIRPVQGQGSRRNSVSIALPPDVADQLAHVIEATGFVQHELLLRILVPEIVKSWQELQQRMREEG